MPAKSKAQERFMAAIAHGNLKKKGLSKETAEDFVGSTKGLPEHKKPLKSKIKENIKKKVDKE
jgi:hypothetical protein